MMGEGVNNKKGGLIMNHARGNLCGTKERETCSYFRINGKRSITDILVNNFHDVGLQNILLATTASTLHVDQVHYMYILCTNVGLVKHHEYI